MIVLGHWPPDEYKSLHNVHDLARTIQLTGRGMGSSYHICNLCCMKSLVTNLWCSLLMISRCWSWLCRSSRCWISPWARMSSSRCWISPWSRSRCCISPWARSSSLCCISPASSLEIPYIIQNIYKVVISVCLSDHNSATHRPICLKFW